MARPHIRFYHCLVGNSWCLFVLTLLWQFEHGYCWENKMRMIREIVFVEIIVLTFIIIMLVSPLWGGVLKTWRHKEGSCICGRLRDRGRGGQISLFLRDVIKVWPLSAKPQDWGPRLYNKKIACIHKNNETNDKFYRKVAFLMYTEIVNFTPQSLKAASKQKPHRGLGTRSPSSW